MAAGVQEWARNVQQGKLTKGDRLGPADHASINYAPFRRNFYIEVPELTRMSAEELVEYRKQLDGIKVRYQPCGSINPVAEGLGQRDGINPLAEGLGR